MPFGVQVQVLSRAPKLDVATLRHGGVFFNKE